MKPKPLTSRENVSKVNFDKDLALAARSPEGLSSGFSFNDQSKMDYLLNRDPMQEFFSLTCQSIKLNSPHMNTICTIDTMQLYKKALKLNIPFFKWQSWIEDFLNKEFMRNVMRNSRRKGISGRPQTTQTFVRIEAVTKQKMMEQASFFQQELEEHQGVKSKGPAKPPKRGMHVKT
mmetsp:Transcript_14702/g.25025  ORF Transcript_14702/g.25025 Transcript_14702/m.25025 type:complete len:176 (-) Transcript_14702:154-681(-)